MATYRQFCPIAKAMEVLDERWTILVVRELLLGSTRFNQLRRGLPRMSPALLSKRLHTLERQGLVARGADGSYLLTDSGRDLYDVVTTLGLWGQRWIKDLGEEDLDPHLLMWDVQRTVPVDAWPETRTVLALHFPDVAPRKRHWWLVVTDGEAEACDLDPGYDVAATLQVPLRVLTRVWRGDTSWADALRVDGVRVDGPERRRVAEWLGTSRLAQLAAAR